MSLCSRASSTAPAGRKPPSPVLPGASRRLLSQPESAQYELAVIYYGTSPNFSCARCKHIFRQRGLKWQLVRQLAFSEAWEQLLQAGQFKYILIADDDLRISTPSLNIYFSIVAQVCEAPPGSFTLAIYRTTGTAF